MFRRVPGPRCGGQPAESLRKAALRARPGCAGRRGRSSDGALPRRDALDPLEERQPRRPVHVQRQPVPRLRARLRLLLRAPDARVPRLLGGPRLRDEAPREGGRAAPAPRGALLAPSWKPETVVMSGVTDCYQPVERTLRITRGCLEVFAELRHPVAVITKSELVTRDLDLLAGLAAHGAAGVSISLTTLDDALARAMEPRASAPARRLAAIRAAADAGVPGGVMLAPVIPGLTDHEMPGDPRGRVGGRGALGRLHPAAASVRRRAPLRRLARAPLPAPEGEGPRAPARIRGGALNDPRFGSRMKGEGPYAHQMRGSSTSRRGRWASATATRALGGGLPQAARPAARSLRSP